MNSFKVGDMVIHNTNPLWSRGKIYGLIPEEPELVIVLWGNGDLEKTSVHNIEPLGWNLHERGNKN